METHSSEDLSLINLKADAKMLSARQSKPGNLELSLSILNYINIFFHSCNKNLLRTT